MIWIFVNNYIYDKETKKLEKYQHERVDQTQSRETKKKKKPFTNTMHLAP